MKKILSWFDHNLLTILTGFLIVFIPLYPKLPLAELIQGYIVRLRLEDLLVLFTFGIWFIQLARRKIVFPKNPLTYAILIYLAIGLLSTLSAIFLTHSVPLIQDHIFKIVFHWIRRIEYFSLYFITISALRRKSDFILFIKTTLITLAGVVIYGMGQKYLYWPAFSTMNREFSKGVKLYLQPNTRLFSTFGGHYDLAAYLTILLSFTVPAFWVVKSKTQKIIFSLLSLFGYWCLVLTTSRTSFIGYVVATTVIALLLMRRYSWWWSLKHWLVTMVISLIIMFSFSNLLERFTQVIPNPQTRSTIIAIQKIVNQPFVREPNESQTVSELPSLFAFLIKSQPLQTIELTDAEKTQLGYVASSSDLPPSPILPSPSPQNLPADVSSSEEKIRQDALESQGKLYTGSGYSPNALKYGLSMGIRLDALWPQAIKGFLSNPLLGSGYSTLVKTNTNEFTYAESTDNDYLRMLGETGILGTIAFLATLYLVFKFSLFLVSQPNQGDYLLGLGGVGASLSLLVTASYIDVFESSKVAYTFWIMAAMIVYRYEKLHSTAKK